MMSKLVELFTHTKCKADIHALMQTGLDNEKKIKSLNGQVIMLLNQIQELKAINDYQALESEQKLTTIETSTIPAEKKGKSNE